VRGEVLLVVPAVADDLTEQAVHQRHVGAVVHREVQIGLPGDRGGARVHREHRRWVRHATPVQLGRPAQLAELAPVYVPLAADEASYVTGARIAVTGGRPIL
jgi:NAD(P)-dependent dehydrogenase (short-subunit alcohol dehydrogenase family)